MHTVTSDTESEVGSIVVDGLVEEVSFQTAFQGVSSGWKSDVKRWSISDCRSQVSKRLFTKLGGESRNAEEQLSWLVKKRVWLEVYWCAEWWVVCT